ncbi:triphosphoribosyl-dephospho-CoA synthase [Methylophaga sp. OBS4]|uniref:triphosphoribosyl-dephospho-CoA synthase n=1 Tax=Methylophaga sp. OBS4 TaxID=2991935 RepID=UPI00224DD2AC|nr:triphosphoribosyl-dephospho-CoA synthase [Methylophaga sp. OBS4]MCX4186379.1 triphosphoribosyl-dephospho-CoA synthase [Methylophaga sp. OBS4]
MLSESDIQQAVIWACEQEVRAPKPGNVNCFSDGHNMAVDDFIRSAHAIAPVMARPGLSVGERIMQAITATRAVVDCNTNLGIVLLFAPLCCAIKQCESFEQLSSQLQYVLNDLSVEDARLCYQAIRMAEAGGLGKLNNQDIAQEPTVTLLEAMDMARDRDQIALQYVSNFGDIWTIALPALTAALDSGESVEWATAFAYLKLLSTAPDSLICRKQSVELAEAVTQKAKQFVFEMNKNNKLDAYYTELTAWDNELKQKAINPGTTADLVAATLLLHAFQQRFSLHRISVP